MRAAEASGRRRERARHVAYASHSRDAARRPREAHVPQTTSCRLRWSGSPSARVPTGLSRSRRGTSSYVTRSTTSSSWRHEHGFAEFCLSRTYSATPQRAEKITSIPAKVIERVARVATSKPALVDVWSRPGQHSNGVQGGRAIAMLEELTAWYEDMLSNELKTDAPKITLAELKALPGAFWCTRRHALREVCRTAEAGTAPGRRSSRATQGRTELPSMTSPRPRSAASAGAEECSTPTL
jgi:hypothetical protein